MGLFMSLGIISLHIMMNIIREEDKLDLLWVMFIKIKNLQRNLVFLRLSIKAKLKSRFID